jgi:hypothetical protein
MNTTQWIALASVATVLVSALAIAATLKAVCDQLRVTVFLTYTERYAKVMNGVPFDARRPGSEYQLNSRPSEEQARVLSAFREYFNLCSEEMWLQEHRRIDRATWRIWERGMRQVAQFPPFREAWLFLASEYEYYDRFHEFVTKELLQPPSASRSLHTPRRPLTYLRRVGTGLSHVRRSWESDPFERDDNEGYLKGPV